MPSFGLLPLNFPFSRNGISSYLSWFDCPLVEEQVQSAMQLYKGILFSSKKKWSIRAWEECENRKCSVPSGKRPTAEVKNMETMKRPFLVRAQQRRWGHGGETSTEDLEGYASIPCLRVVANLQQGRASIPCLRVVHAFSNTDRIYSSAYSPG